MLKPTQYTYIIIRNNYDVTAAVIAIMAGGARAWVDSSSCSLATAGSISHQEAKKGVVVQRTCNTPTSSPGFTLETAHYMSCPG